MQGDINPNLDVEPVAALIDALYAGGERATFIAGMRNEVERLRANAKEYAEALDRFYNQVKRAGVDPELIARAIDSARRRSETARERLHPHIEKFKQRKDAPFWHNDEEVRRLVTEFISIAESCIEQTIDLHNRVLQLATERRATADNILRACPVAGEVDYEALSREHMARYPKIRAALAK
ncbi:MAG: hypothetical protein ACREFQ_20510 [Stellaceae bacterium]